MIMEKICLSAITLKSLKCDLNKVDYLVKWHLSWGEIQYIRQQLSRANLKKQEKWAV